MVIVIRAGGGGSRLWPLSRKQKPKQYHALLGEKTLIRDTYERIAELLASPNDLFVSVGDGFSGLVQEQLPELVAENVIEEPDKRNTGPAIALEVAMIARTHTPETVIATLTSDDFISDPAAFRDVLTRSEAFLQEHPDFIVTPGIAPTKVDTGYSYMHAGEQLQTGENNGDGIFAIDDWIEKPGKERCKALIDSGEYYTHAGMYIWRLDTIQGLFRTLQPELYATCERVAELLVAGTEEARNEATTLYAALEEDSIESAITNHVENIATAVSGSMGWSDLGKWHILQDMLPATEGTNVVRGAHAALQDVNGSLIFAPKDKVVAVIGLEDVVIVDTPDALLVAKKDDTDDVKKITKQLKSEGREDVL